MFIDLVDDLRCPRPHEETWLVASADRTEGRDIIEGTLGCPICRAEYPIRAGTVWFVPEARQPPLPRARADVSDPELAVRLAAFLDLADAQGFALLCGSWARFADQLRDLVPARLVLLNPDPPAHVTAGVSALQIPDSIPLADAACLGVALDDAHADPPHAAAAVRILRPRGRLLAPASVPVPDGVTELARDDRLWVAQRDAAPPKLVALRGRGGG